MSKVTLTSVGSIQQNPTSAATEINSNFTTIQTAFDNTLSRDGTTPNVMGSNFDMNNNHILNLPPPVGALDPVRLGDLTAVNGAITINAIPPGGTTGQALTKTSNADYQVSWATSPAGGSNGQVLFNSAGGQAGNAGLTYVAGGALSISPTVASNTLGLKIVQSTPNGGSIAGPLNLNTITVTDGTQTVTGTTDSLGQIANRTTGLQVNYNVTGGAANHFGIDAMMNVTGTNGGVSGVLGGMSFNSGTTITGNGWGVIGFGLVQAGTTLNQSMIGVEGEVGIATGGSARDRVAISASGFGPVAATGIDVAYLCSVDTTELSPFNGAAPFKKGMYFSKDFLSANTFPVATTGDIFAGDTGTVANFANFTTLTVTGNIFSFPNFTMTGSGSAIIGAGSGSLVANTFTIALPTLVNSNGAGAFRVGPNGITTPTFQVDSSVGSAVTGLYLQSQAAAGGMQLFTTSTATNEGIGINSKGTGSITLGSNTGSAMTVNIGKAGAQGTLALAASVASVQNVIVTGTAASGNATLPIGTYNIVGDSIAATFTNKTFDSAGTGNSLKVSGVTVSAGQYPGETSTGSATAGNVGEYATGTGGAVAAATSTSVNATSVSLTAGDWDVSGSIVFSYGATTTVQGIVAGINTTSATLGSLGTLNSFNFGGVAIVPNGNFTLSTPVTRISLSTTTTVFLVGLTVYATSTGSINSSTIRARRVR